MAIYVFRTADGTLFSEIPDTVTIAQAQASGQLASAQQLSAAGFSAIDGLPALSPTVAWNAATKTTITVVAPTAANVIDTFDFIMAFTAAELAAIRASTNANIQQFLFALQVTQGVNLNSTSIANSLQFSLWYANPTDAAPRTPQSSPRLRRGQPNGWRLS